MDICSVCKLFNTNRCVGKDECKIEESINNICLETKMPLKDLYELVPSDEDVSSFERLKNIKNNIVKFVNEGNILFIYSNNCGNGKTSWSKKLCTKYVNDMYESELEDYRRFCLSDRPLNIPSSKKMFIWNMDKINKCAMFVNTTELLYKKKQSFNSNDTSVDDYINKVLNTDLLVLDDIGIANSSAYDITFLYNIINYRIEKRKTTIFTANKSLESLNSSIDSRIYDRITGGVLIEFKGKSMRLANKEW